MKSYLWLAGAVLGLAAMWLMSAWSNELRRNAALYPPPKVCAAEAQMSREWTRFHARPPR